MSYTELFGLAHKGQVILLRKMRFIFNSLLC